MILDVFEKPQTNRALTQGGRPYNTVLQKDPRLRRPVGSKVTAKHRIEPGEAICFDEPLVEYPNPAFSHPVFEKFQQENVLVDLNGFLQDNTDLDKFLHNKDFSVRDSPVCFGCHSPRRIAGVNYVCSKCKVPICSRKCEKLQVHQTNECTVIQESNMDIMNTHKSLYLFHLDIATVRALRTYENAKNGLENYCKLQFTMLRFHSRVSNFRKSRNHRVIFGNSSESLNRILPISMAFNGNEEFVEELACIICVLSECLPWNLTCCTILPFMASLQHSCAPNLEFTLHSPTDVITDENTNLPKIPHEKQLQYKVKFVATRPIKRGQRLNVDFCYKPLTGRFERNALLRRKYIYDCSCPFCKSASENGLFANAIKCLDKKCTLGYILPSDMSKPELSVWICDRCTEKMEANEVIHLIQTAAEELKKIPADFSHSFQMYCTKWMKIFHPNHYIVVDAMKRRAMCVEQCIFNGSWVLLISVRNEIGEQMLKRRPKLHFTVANYEFMRDYCCLILKYLNQLCLGCNWKRALVMRQLFFMNFIILLWESKLRQRTDQDAETVPFCIEVRRGICILRESSEIMLKYYALSTEIGDLARRLSRMTVHLEAALGEMSPSVYLTNLTMLRRLLFTVVRGMIKRGVPCPEQESLLSHV